MEIRGSRVEMMEVKRRKMVFSAMVLVLVVALSGRRAVDARVYRQPGATDGGYKLHSVVKEYANQQGFEAKLVVSSPSGNDTLGRDIGPLSFIAR